MYKVKLHFFIFSLIMMYSFHKRLFLDAYKVDSFGLAFPNVGFETNVYYRLCNDIILCDDGFHQNAEDIEKTYYTLETYVGAEKRYIEHEFFKWGVPLIQEQILSVQVKF